jgi:hypothetical protein
MSKRHNQSRKSKQSLLAVAIAAGTTIQDWAEQNKVRPRTAYTWAASPEVQKEVERIRREAVDCAIGRLSHNATAAAESITTLAKEAGSESVKLSAARAVLADLMSVSDFATLEKRLVEVERRMTESSQLPVPGWQQDPTSPPRPATDL